MPLPCSKTPVEPARSRLSDLVDAVPAPPRPKTPTAPGSTANQPGVRGDTTAFGEDTQRGYAQTAAFASVDFDIIPGVLTIGGGSRYFNYRESEVGSQYGTGSGCVN